MKELSLNADEKVDGISNNEGFDYNADYTNYRQDAIDAEISSQVMSLFEEQQEAQPQESTVDKVNAGLEKRKLEKELSQDETSLAGDIARGFAETPRALVNAPAAAINEMLQNTEDLGDDLNDFIDLGGFQILDSEGNLDIEYISGQEKKERGLSSPQLPRLDDPKSTTGKLIQTIAQFVVGFKGVDKAAKALQIAGKGGKAGAAAKGAIADLAVFDEQEGRLSNIIQDSQLRDLPVIGTISEYLAANEDDPFLRGKLKQGLEGAGLGYLVDVAVSSIRAVKTAQKIKSQSKTAIEKEIFDIPLEDQAGVKIDPESFDFLGGNKDDLVSRKQLKMTEAEKEVGAAFGNTKQVTAGAGDDVIEEGIEINFNRINQPEDIKQLMSEMLNKPELKASIESARRGKRSAADTLTAAQDIDGFESLMSRRTGDAFNAEQITAARLVYNETTNKLMEAAKRAADVNATSVDQYNFRKLVATHHAIQKEFMGMRAEAGRALQAWSIPAGEGAEQVRQLEQLLNEFGGSDTSRNLARRLAAAGDSLTTDQINEMTKKGAMARSVDAISEAWTLGLLTNPQTHVVNLSSNLLTSFTLAGERAIAAGFKDSPVSIKEASNLTVGMMESMKDAVRFAGRAFVTGESGFGVGKIELPRVRATSMEAMEATGAMKPFAYAMDAWGRVLNVAGRSLLAGDEFSKTVLYRGQLKALATRQGIDQGISGKDLAFYVEKTIADPSAAMRADALDFAKYGTFTRELGKAGQGIQNTISNLPVLRFVVPFLRTPANIFKFTYERTPLALIARSVRDDIRAGGLRAANAYAKIGSGTAAMMITSDAAMSGYITGGGPVDPKQKASLRRKGWQPYSIRIGDKYYSYSRFEPVATLWGISADLSEILTNYESYDIAKQEEVENAFVAVTTALANQAVGKTFLSGVADLSNVLADPGRYADTFINRYAASFVPAGVAAIERAQDPEMEYVTNIIDALKARLPYVSGQVADRLNVYGEPIQYFVPTEDGMLGSTGSRVASLFNPIYTSNVKDSPIDDFLLKNGLTISMPRKIQRFGDVEIDMKNFPEAYSELVRLRGQEVVPIGFGVPMQEFLNDLVQGNDFRSISFLSDFKDNDDRQLDLSGYIRKYEREAKITLLDKFPDLEEAIGEEAVNMERRQLLEELKMDSSSDRLMFP